jgi:hypothetical protein
MQLRRNKKAPVFRVLQMEEIKAVKRMQWDTEFDEHLTFLVTHTKHKSWREISNAMTLKFPHVPFTSKKCRARWKNSVDPSLCKLNLNNAEELISLAYHYTYKNQWTIIAQYLPHRHNNILRNNFHGLIRKLVSKVLSSKSFPSKVTPLIFLQSLYTAIYIEELLDLHQPPSDKNNLVPLYIYNYVIESSLRKSKLRQYVLNTRNLFVEFHKSHPKLSLLTQLSYEELTGGLLKTIVNKIQKNLTAQMKISDNFILELIEHALLLYFSSNSLPVSSIFEYVPRTSMLDQSFCGYNYAQFYTMAVPGSAHPISFHSLTPSNLLPYTHLSTLGNSIPLSTLGNSIPIFSYHPAP